MKEIMKHTDIFRYEVNDLHKFICDEQTRKSVLKGELRLATNEEDWVKAECYLQSLITLETNLQEAKKKWNDIFR